MKTCAMGLIGGLLALCPATAARAALVVADFNDVTPGAINGKGGGTGWTSTWSGSAGGTVVAGDLTSSLYNAPQSGTPQHFRNVNATGLRQNYRAPTALAGTVWFSFLAMAESTGDRAGLSINAPTASPFDNPGTANAYLVGTTLNYQFGTGTAGTLANASPLGTPVLIVGRVTINSAAGAADPTTLWVNPDLIASPDITTITPTYNNAGVDWLSSITTIGAIAARLDTATTGGGNVDNIRFSDGGGNSAQAYADVTTTPEPGLALGAAVAFGMALRRRPRAAR